MRQRQREERLRRLEAEDEAQPAADNGNGEDSMSSECTICMSRPRNAAFPCGHVVACLSCAYRCNGCPVCRRRGEPVELFYS